MKYKQLTFIGVLCAFAFSHPVDARETLIQLPNGGLNKIITDFKGTRVYNNGNLVYSSDGDNHEQTMNKILKSGGSLVSDNKSFSFSISSRVPAIGPPSTTTSGNAASRPSGVSSFAPTSGLTSAPSTTPASDLASPSSATPAPGSAFIPNSVPDDEE